MNSSCSSRPAPIPSSTTCASATATSFVRALTAAVEQLSERDRSVLRCHLVERMSIDRIGEVYSVHRATAARWLASIRERLFERTRENLTARLEIGTSEYDSIMRLIQSQLHVSLGPKLED